MNTVLLKAHLAVLTAVVIWATSFIALKVAVGEVAPMVVIFLRMIVGSLAFIAAWPWIRHGINYQPGDWKYLVGMALFEPCFYFIFEAQAMLYTSAGQAGMITSMLPLMVAAAAYFIFKERNSLRQWSGFIIAVIGVVWMTLSSTESEQAPNPILGNFLEFGAMVMAVGYTLFVKHLTRRYSAFVLTAIQSFVGVVFFLPLALVSDWPSHVSLNAVGCIVYLGLVVSLGGYGLYNYSLSHIKASTSAGYINLLPAFTLVFSMLLLGERLISAQWIAIGIVFFGVLLSQERNPPIPKEVPPGATG
ncbi:DMT family transporter [Reinekea marinisedimentorum]|uniref:Drug/metabolite transporter (DMT)-like permease n=1 Tax=Reinekea marinisedimentorum TaxID=230495 RepID=A0A4R3I6F1_9GAMM|nr:DMT family transporter [Reinekea marinisedimentorum]TCS40383.1 drug/metabolite transporter (DMT)-like permease [Reinekea marinisedimentorum]